MTELDLTPPVTVPAGLTADSPIALHTGTACLAFMDPHFVEEVWEDLLYDGHDHDHGDGGLALNSASMATHVEYDGDFPMVVFRDGGGCVGAVEVQLDPYSESWSSPVAVPTLEHSHDEHGHDGHSGHGHEHGHVGVSGWSAVSTVTLITDRVHAGDPAGLPQADDTGGLVDLVFPAPGGRLDVTVLSEDHTRTLMRMVWLPKAA